MEFQSTQLGKLLRRQFPLNGTEIVIDFNKVIAGGKPVAQQVEVAPSEGAVDLDTRQDIEAGRCQRLGFRHRVGIIMVGHRQRTDAVGQAACNHRLNREVCIIAVVGMHMQVDFFHGNVLWRMLKPRPY
ncbi:hypothetical protein D3C75_1046100 [compost metagenome]